MHSSGPILGKANRYYGYEICNHLSVEWQRTEFREFGYTGSSDDISGCWIAVTICVSGARHSIVTDCRSNRFPGNTVLLLLNGKRNICICGNEYVPLLVIDAAMQTLVTYSKVPTQRDRGRIVVLSLQPFMN
jgi:hypothetical protein